MNTKKLFLYSICLIYSFLGVSCWWTSLWVLDCFAVLEQNTTKKMFQIWEILCSTCLKKRLIWFRWCGALKNMLFRKGVGWWDFACERMALLFTLSLSLHFPFTFCVCVCVIVKLLLKKKKKNITLLPHQNQLTQEHIAHNVSFWKFFLGSYIIFRLGFLNQKRF